MAEVGKVLLLCAKFLVSFLACVCSTGKKFFCHHMNINLLNKAYSTLQNYILLLFTVTVLSCINDFPVHCLFSF